MHGTWTDSSHVELIAPYKTTLIPRYSVLRHIMFDQHTHHKTLGAKV